jgi:hypothetical protein
MDVTTQFSEASLEQKITTLYGILLSQTQLAELLGRTPVVTDTLFSTNALSMTRAYPGRPGVCWRTCSPGLTTGRCV